MPRRNDFKRREERRERALRRQQAIEGLTDQQRLNDLTNRGLGGSKEAAKLRKRVREGR